MIRKSYRGTPVLFWIGLMLLCITLFLSHLSIGLYARYATSDTAGDSARVAEFKVSDQIDGAVAQSFTVNVALYPSQEKGYVFTITNDGEVTVDYVVRVKNLTNNLPLEFRAKKGEEAIIQNANGEFIVSVAIGKTEAFTLNVLWPAGANALAWMGQVDLLEITLTAQQSTAE